MDCDLDNLGHIWWINSFMLHRSMVEDSGLAQTLPIDRPKGARNTNFYHHHTITKTSSKKVD